MSTEQHSQFDAQHTAEILSQTYCVPVDEVAKLYQREWTELASTARITQFLDIFATRKVREILRSSPLSSSPSARRTQPN